MQTMVKEDPFRSIAVKRPISVFDGTFSGTVVEDMYNDSGGSLISVYGC